MRYKQSPAFDVLAELNDHYLKTNCPDTALKIISLVESELKYELDPHCRMEPEPEKGFFETVFGVRFGKTTANKAENDPFRFYRTLSKERDERRKTRYFENLNARFGVEATLKRDDWVRAVDVDARAKEIFELFFSSLPRLARDLSFFKQEFKELQANKAICIDEAAYHNLYLMNRAVDGIATTIKGLILSNGDEYQRFDDSGYIDFFLNVDKEDPQDKLAVFLIETKLINLETLTVLRAVADERLRQISVEGYTTDHDDEHTDGSIANAAAHYICADDNINLWTWDKNFDKKEKHSRDKQLLIGSAMTVAEMERRNRATKMLNVIKENSTDLYPLFVDRKGQYVDDVKAE